MEVIVDRPAALDVHKEQVTACVRVPAADGTRSEEVVQFQTTVRGLLTLRDWLEAHRVGQVAMDATGVYWKPVWAVLEDDFELLLVNARHVKQVPGRKTDVSDAAWLCQLLEAGLLRASFVPPKPIRALRNFTRYRKAQIADLDFLDEQIDRLSEAIEEPRLGDDVVSLRPLASGDASAVEAALDDPEITRWFDNSGVSAQDVVDRAASRWEQSEAAEFAIVDGGDCVGSIWLNLGPSDRAGVGYWLLPRARGKGLVTRALLLVSRWAFDELGVKRISLLTDPRNASSLRAAERAGFHREGVLRSWADVNGERVDHVSFSLLPSDLSRGPSSAS